MLLIFGFFLSLTRYTVRAGVSIDGARGTVYYDLELQCNGAGSDAGGASGLNGALTACGYSAQGLGTSRFVAIDGSIFDKSMCGQEVLITHNGAPFTFSEGPIFVGDLCGGCQGGKVLDLSGKIAVEMMGGQCKNPPSFSYQITENTVGATLEGSLPPGEGSSQPVSSAPAVPSISTPAIQPPASQTPVSQPPISQPAIPTVSRPVVPTTQPVPSVPPVSKPFQSPATQPAIPATTPVVPTKAARPTTTPVIPTVPATAAVIPPANTGKHHWGGGWGRPGALFAENESSANEGSCKRRRRRRRLTRAH
ncbi:hypothetical protein I302_106376 [Kwoniella bestiolae CBS 10118]|uniref:Barwin domain-containing protein n=1 Tax=Kwoniella bestiolae CBS 10118 TaxID=1296100 RepID=A0A1B9G3S2_9TREE|nr:hypothetical protein I302_05499 [Kwoniella bestiolae CBS 10118]OCF25675.1 hypothetical protein I302_05499 [Kwoniella bestiolae CBS 10118]